MKSDQLKLGRQYRSFQLNRDSINVDERTVELAFSSEIEVARWWGVEILGHDKKECDLEWVASGRAPLLKDHDWRQQIGVVQSAEIGTDRKGRAIVRFGKNARAEEEFQDVRDGVRSNVSVGYEITEVLLVKEDKGVCTYRVTGWRPLEISLVSVPADTSVGVGRSGEDDEKPVRVTREPNLPEEGTRNMETITPAPAPAVTSVPDAVRSQLLQDERQRVKDITYLGSRHNLGQDAAEAIAKGLTLDQFRGVVLQKIEERGGNTPLYAPAAEIGLSEREAQSFSVRNFMRSLIERNPALAPFEHDCARTVRDALAKVGVQARQGGSFLPYDVMCQPIPGMRVEGGRVMLGQRDLSTSSIGAGGAMVSTDLLAADFITLLRNASLVRRMGARVLSGLL